MITHIHSTKDRNNDELIIHVHEDGAFSRTHTLPLSIVMQHGLMEAIEQEGKALNEMLLGPCSDDMLQLIKADLHALRALYRFILDHK